MCEFFSVPEPQANRVQLYTTVLSLLAIFASKRWSLVARWHVNLVYLLTFFVFVYRDLYPLTTLNERPLDIAEGTLLWIKITVLFAVGVLMPLITPRLYTPFDSNNPMEPNPEQTASPLSMITYSFLDPIVFLACRVPYLARDQLPVLADYDYAHNLKLKSFKYLDVFAKAKESHIGWGFLRVFRFEYTLMGILVGLLGLTTFISPFAINRLLSYLEGDKVTTVRPWVWIVCLFMGPLVTSILYQRYIFFGTRTLVRCEAIITQLVFEHSLRIRMKAETEKVERDGSLTELPTSQMEHSCENTASSMTSTIEEEGNSQDTTLVSNVPASVSEGSLLVKSPSIKSTSPKSTTKNKEALKKSGSPTGSSSASNLVGRINNLVTTDLGNIIEARDLMFVLVFVPLQIVACIAFLYWILGWSAFVGLAVMILLFPFPGYVAKRIQVVQEGRLKKTDARVQTVTEAMNMLRMIKLFGWESKMQDRISEKREDELVWLWKRELLDLVNGNLNSAFLKYAPLNASNLVYTVIMKQELKPSIVFSSMTVFDLFRDQLFIGFYMVNALVSGKVSLDRVNDFLKNTELLDAYAGKDRTLFSDQPRAGDERIGFNDASFAWSAESDGSLTPSKRRYQLKIEHELLFKPKGFNVIVGPTGSGKTSILMALLGEMHYLPNGPSSWFNLPRQNGVAYAAQESWVLNETIKENILFGSPYERERYQKVLYQCGLERDLDLFEAGDETEVGEKGLTVSGGQKARITLARAIYSPAQIILLDDVLAALDVHTAKWVVDKCFSGDLVKGRTIILVTHNIAMIRSLADFAVSIGTDGSVVAQGTILEVVGIDKSVSEELQRNEEEIEMAEEVLDKVDEPALPKSGGKLIAAEEMEEGHISWESVKLFFIGLGGNHPALFFVAFLGGLLVVEFINAFQTWFLGYWASQYERRPASEVSVFYYLGTYVALMGLSVILYMVAFVVFIYGVIRASRHLHSKLVESVLGTTLRWLDTTPASRIITRCTQDIRALDGPLKDGLRNLTEITMAMLTRLGAVVFMTPMFLIPGFFVGLFGGWVGRIYMAAQLSVKREMSNAKAPVVGHFGAAISGLTSIRAYGAQEAFVNMSMDRINRYTRASRVMYNLNRWVCIRIDIISGLFAAGLGVHLVYFQDQTTANIGFSLNMAVGFSGMILWWIRLLNDFEVQGYSLERIQAYLTIEQESKPTARGLPPAYWPASGSLVVENLSAKYSQDGPKVLHDISFEVKSGERVGIVGRTGSGKASESSLTLALLRCIPTEGDVLYDGVKTSDINLDSLRSTVTIIPQIPELLSGSLRHNLDPFDQYDDAALNDALRAAGLSELQSEMDDNKITLDTQVSSGGGNLSVGQRQILALARAIVRGSKLLILDEGTYLCNCFVDHKTDNAIQSSLRHELGHDTTVITIAHRLQTIMDGDKVMVLDAGRIVEYDSPANLLKNKNGFLHSLVEESGDKQHLYEMANAKHSLQS
ncbi:hypothetical protein AGABI1DRAFT_66408 [Agaricus bisporus var. burnettii JB137-S8]|uniref:P-loop containing nucleoside triphosphate hydrolase protein n=1 Tax=Agaricus bisporus var. burnettii (strain JB137-S8 / ATCC MYA-4627 / FGSC 10392) TaxID=597362 RepID=K5X6X4_AGABU|nr:uncharacterized protein AGABI1DRAFT_66408 [Agaricus bisporus var. burnettii JB137-S8]EKM83611.1 hypothetical protein AGABI1DRAFT_66408 [Agaricus bisporus var. burnettii JB137-S8]